MIRDNSRPRPNGQGMLTVREVAGLLNIHPNTVRQWSDRGLLPTYRLGPRRDRRFQRTEIAQFIEANGRGHI